ncbi:MAG: nicotianamine synthase family protein [Euryarchaeota archaeon]|nr:nicotianamine synthase family protein [Euryarchaeota archaeon]
MCYYVAESVTEEIMAIYSVIQSIEAEECYQNISNNLNTVFQRLDYLIVQDICDKRAEEFLYNPGFSSAFDAISSFRSLYTAEIEVEHAKAIIKSGDPWKALKKFAYISNYLQLAKTEYQGSQLKPGGRVLFLGSGPLPISLIILCRLYGLRGVGIEQEPDRAELSRMVLQKLGLSDQIRIIEGNQYTLPL